MLKSTRKEDPVPYPARPPLKRLVNQENSILRVAKPTNASVDWAIPVNKDTPLWRSSLSICTLNT